MKSLASDFSHFEKIKFKIFSIILSIICIGFFVYSIVTSQYTYVFNAIFFGLFAFAQYQLMSKTIFRLADEVWDTGLSLKIKRNNIE
nr:hypothetical protein [uncultured Moraxella sp.]